MSEPNERPPSPIPVPWPFRPPYDLEPCHPLYNHVTRDRERQADVQSQWDAEWDEFDRYYQQESRIRRTRTEQAHHQTMAPPMPPQPHQRHNDQGRHDPPAEPRGGGTHGHEGWRYLGRDRVRDSPDSEWVEARKPTIHIVTDIYGLPPGDPLYRPHLRYTPRESDHEGAQEEQAATPPKINVLIPDPLRDPINARVRTGHGRSSHGGKGYVTLTLGDEHLDIWDWSED